MFQLHMVVHTVVHAHKKRMRKEKREEEKARKEDEAREAAQTPGKEAGPGKAAGARKHPRPEESCELKATGIPGSEPRRMTRQ